MEWHAIDYCAPEAPSQFVASIREIGFAVLREIPVTASFIAAVYRDWEAFFLSSEKYAYQFDPAIQSGYFPFQSETAKGNDRPDLKEFFHLYEWTELPSGMSDRTWQLFHRLRAVAETLLEWLEQGLPPQVRRQLLTPLSDTIRASTQTLLRPIHYPPLPRAANGALRAAAHEDINLITLLPAATATGLEVQAESGEWIGVPNRAGEAIVNVGDMLQLATGGFYRSTSHRVVNPTGEASQRSRFSMPLFLHPRPEIHLTPDITADDYLKARLKALGLQD
ncbi:2OG-Fe(II) oxygenase family protein [Altericista sp. CCNU0014]|uniref:2OG-Fe(II) oxygenase family protein n=1 Tax=Altericista sp. CCNU0014 TaxID=3082949 RepID=UPI003851485D